MKRTSASIGGLGEIVAKLERARDEADCWTEIPRLRDLADAVAPILKAPPPALQSRLDELWESVVRYKSPPDKSVFAVRPRGRPRDQHLWWLRLLLVISTVHARRLHRLVPVKVSPKRAAELRENAKKAWAAFHANYRGGAEIKFVLEAVNRLCRMVPSGLELHDRFLVWDGVKIPRRLSPMEQHFMKLLLDARGRSVSAAAFRGVNVNHPEKIKYRLTQKRQFSFLSGMIAGDGGRGYRLENS